MTPGGDRLLRDPIFQLNLVLWLVQDMPSNDVRPILRDNGYLLDAVARRLPMSPSVRERLRVVLDSHPAVPDAILTHVETNHRLVIECRANSFGPDTHQSRQATKFLAASADLAQALGLEIDAEVPGHVGYLVPENVADQLPPTLRSLQQQLRDRGVEPAPGCAIPLSRDDAGLHVGPVNGDTPPRPAAEAMSDRQLVVKVEPGDDPRPLYLVPWDPSVEQDDDLERRGRAQLEARFLNEMIGIVGRLGLPANEVVLIDELLERATLGVSRFWRDRSTVHRVLVAGRDAIEQALSAKDIQVSSGGSPIHIQLIIGDETVRERVIDALDDVRPLESLARRPVSQEALFDPADEMGVSGQ